MHGLLLVPQPWYFMMDEICAYVYLCGFDRSNPLILVLYGDVIVFVGFLEQIMTWCLKTLVHDDNLRDDQVRLVDYDLELCSFIFKGGQYSLEV